MTKNQRRFRVLHAPYDVGGNAYYLAQGERKHGFNAKTLVYFKQWFGYPVNYHLKLKPGANPLRYIRWWIAMMWVALTRDVLHFNFGGSFLTDVTRRWVFADLPLWRRLGIATFITFQGCDSRISSYVLKNFAVKLCTNCRSREFCQQTYDSFKLEVVSQAARYFDKVFAINPDLIRNIPEAQFLPYSNCDLDAWKPPADYDWHHPGPVRVLHAPTWRELKGTDYIVAAIEELRAEGENVELVLVENVPHNQVKSLYASADLLVDQLLSGWYGGLAVELMALGKPVIAYIREEDLQFIPPEMRHDLPIISADPTTLKEVLRQLLRDPKRRKQLGIQSRAFVEKWHHPRVVAKITTEAYREALTKRPPAPGMWQRLQLLLHLTRPLREQFFALCGYYALGSNVRRRCVAKLKHVLLTLMLSIIRFLSFLRLHTGHPASVWGITPILTLPKLSQADRLLGFKSRSAVFVTYRITQSFDYVFEKAVNFVVKHAPAQYAAAMLQFLYRSILLWALFKFDVFHFFYDQGFLEREGRFGVNPEELHLLRRAGKRVYLYAYGADVRTRKATVALGKYHCCLHCDRVGVHCICDDEEAARKQAFYQQHATALISMGDMMEYVPGAKNLYYWPMDIHQIPYIGVSWDGIRPLKILHAPNHEWAKGSWYLREAVQNLRRQGIGLELLEISNVSNKEVLQLMVSPISVVAVQPQTRVRRVWPQGHSEKLERRCAYDLRMRPPLAGAEYPPETVL